MNKAVIEFLKKKAILIKESQFQELYSIASPDMRTELTNFFLNAKINILPYISFIPSYAMSSNLITEITIPYNIKSIKTLAFDHCLNLEKVIIEDGVKLIDVFAFKNCISLKNIELGNSLEVINAYAFINCQELNTIKFPKTLKEIKYNIFKNCYSLKDIYYEGTIEEWKKININKRNDQLFTCTIHCIDGDYNYDY